jgi:hypothetical protein
MHEVEGGYNLGYAGRLKFMKWLAGMMCCAVAVSSARAADRWPPNVCKGLAFEEWLQDSSFSDQPGYRALARASLLRLLQDHCGVDTTAKMKADDAAAGDEDKRRRQTTCTTVPLPGGLATTTSN